MAFSNQPSGGDVDPGDDPLSPFNARTVRQSSERGSTMPLDDVGPSSSRGSGTQVDGADFATRPSFRRQRQGSARVYPERFGAMAQRIDSRQLFLIFGALLLLLVALLLFLWSRRDNTVGTATGTGAQTAETSAQPTAAGLIEPPTGVFATIIPEESDPALGGDPLPVDAQPTAGQPAGAPAGPAFVVAGTATEGLFLRAEGSSGGNVLATLPEGTRVEALGEETNDGTRTWKKVRTDQGEGWVAAEFLVPAP